MSEYINNKLGLDDATRESFIVRQHLTQEQWRNAEISWDKLVEIANDHIKNTDSLKASAAMYSGIIQGIDGVHSVRWRVKDPEHLLAKIIRKRSEKKEAYAGICVSNYFDIVTDLVGIRALHLFKDDIAGIHQDLHPLLTDLEGPVANIREGDSASFIDLCKNLGLEVKFHDAGYRSIHYVKTVKPLNRNLHVEIQLRTVFEEGWSEVDHQVRYPNLSDDPLVSYASQILNRLSGMADEMSTYARQLRNELEERSAEILVYQENNTRAMHEIEKLITELSNERQNNQEQKEIVDQLKLEMKKVRITLESEKGTREKSLYTGVRFNNALSGYAGHFAKLSNDNPGEEISYDDIKKFNQILRDKNSIANALLIADDTSQ